ncbi:MAG: endonuclease/exonuclease/phosphatase family protein [Mangrovibacterium sp.]
MKTIQLNIAVVAIIFSLFSCSTGAKKKESATPEQTKVEELKNKLNVMSFNIRFGEDGINNWEFRKEMATKVLEDYKIDVAGLQEVVAISHEDLKNILTNYEIWGEPTGDSQKYGGIWSPVVYNKNKFDKLDAGNFWLSETPDVESRGWDARDKRIVSWVKLKSKETGSEFFFFNTHFDHKGAEARKQSAMLILNKIDEIAGDATTILTGDFNFDKTKEAEPYNIMVSKDNKQVMKDTRKDSEKPYTGPNSSFNGFGRPQDVIIDYLFVSQKIQTYTYDILRIQEGDVYISDHYPIMCEIGFN